MLSKVSVGWYHGNISPAECKTGLAPDFAMKATFAVALQLSQFCNKDKIPTHNALPRHSPPSLQDLPQVCPLTIAIRIDRHEIQCRPR